MPKFLSQLVIKLSGLFLLLILLPCKIYAQNPDATGKLIDKETGLPVQNAGITGYNGKKIIFQLASDSAGTFRISFNTLAQIGYIRISSLNYDDLRVDISNINPNFGKTEINLGVFKVIPHKIELKEVKIKPSKRYRDTSRIDLSNKKFDRSVMVDDFFSKESGFTNDDKGHIFYKGKLVTELVVNGSNFFGKNNVDIYRLLPAMVLDKIEVVETNIDSVTNTTLLSPRIKVNLKFKDKFLKGKFGNVNLGAGTASRYIANTGLYSYKNNEQISAIINSNNINGGDNTVFEPKVDFSANGNNVNTNNAKLTYRNLYNNKLELNLSVKGKEDDKSFTSESDRQEEGLDLFSKTFSTSNTRSFSIENSSINLNYRIDTLNTLSLNQTFDYLHTRESDSLSYLIKTDTLTTSSLLNRLKTTNNNQYSTDVNYQHKFSSKKGRLLTVDLKANNNSYNIKETDYVYNAAGQAPDHYYVDGNRHATENKYAFDAGYFEPISDSCYINFFAIYERGKINYSAHITSDTIIPSPNEQAVITNNFIKPGVKFERNFRKITFDAIVTGIIDLRNIGQGSANNITSFFNTDLDIKAGYNITKTRSLSLNYTATAAYPSLDQLTSLNNSFDLIAQSTSNVYLRPQEKNSINLNYSFRPTDRENIIIGGQFDHYTSTFGYRINTSTAALQTSTLDNIGGSNSAQLSFTLLKTTAAGKYLNYSSSIAYQESPALINNKRALNNGTTLSQSLSTSVDVIKSIFSITPILSSSYSKFFYQANTINIFTFTYSDKLSFQAKGYQLNLYPLYNFNHSIGNNSSFSTNGELKRSFFKNYATAWVQAYDIFNSFKFYNNNIGSSYYQTVRYSNIHRYIIIGFSYKFNNIR